MKTIENIINEQLNISNVLSLDDVYKDFDKLDGENKKRRIEESLNSNFMNIDYMNICLRIPHYWKILDDLFLDLNQENQKKIFDYLKRCTLRKAILPQYMLNIFLKYISGESIDRKVYFCNKYLNENLKTDFLYNPIVSNEFKCLWFINKLKENDNYIYIENEDSNFFEFNNGILFQDLFKVLRGKESEWQLYEHNYLMDNTSVKVLSDMLKKKKLIFTDSQMELLLTSKIIQVIYVNLILNNVEVSDEIKKSLLENIDKKFEWYGEEMNEFLSKYDKNYSRENHFFKSKIYSPLVADLEKNTPFIEMSDESSLSCDDIKAIVDNLIRDLNDTDSVNDISAQNDEIIKWVENVNNWDDNGRALFLTSELIEDKHLRCGYEKSIASALCFGLKNNFLDVEKIRQYFNLRIKVNKSKFSIYDSKIISEMINCGYEEDSIKLLSGYTPCYMDFNFKNPNCITLAEFINSEVGYYYSSLKKLSVTILTEYKKSIISKITMIDKNLEEYLEGMFIKLFNENDINFDSINTFLGFCHNYNLGSKSKYCSPFVNTVKNIINDSSFHDEIILRNISIILVENINPLDNSFDYTFFANEYSSKIFLMILTLFFKYDHEEELRGNWVLFFLNNMKYQMVLLDFVRRNAVKMHISELNILFNIFSESKKNDFDKTSVSFFADIPNLSEAQPENVDKLISFYKIIIQNNLVDIDYIFISAVDRTLNDLFNSGFNIQIKNYIEFLKLYIPNNEIKNLIKKYL